MKLSTHTLTFLLVVLGALNWGLIGLFNFNLVTALGLTSGVTQFVYILIGAAAVYEIIVHPKSCKECMSNLKAAKKK